MKENKTTTKKQQHACIYHHIKDKISKQSIRFSESITEHLAMIYKVKLTAEQSGLPN